MIFCFCNDVIRSKKSKCIKAVCSITHLALALTVSEIFDLKKVGQDHKLQLPERCRSMANNIKSLKVILFTFVLALTISEILIFEIFYLEKLGQGHGVDLLLL